LPIEIEMKSLIFQWRFQLQYKGFAVAAEEVRNLAAQMDRGVPKISINGNTSLVFPSNHEITIKDNAYFLTVASSLGVPHYECAAGFQLRYNRSA